MRRLCWFAAPFSAAVFLAVYLLPEEIWMIAGGICALLALPGLLLRGGERVRWMAAALGLAAGLCWSGLYSTLFHSPARALAGREETVSAVVKQWPTQSRYGCAAVVQIRTPEGRTVHALLYLSPAEHVPLPELRPGDVLTVQAQFRLANTAGGVESTYYYSKNIQLIAYADEALVERPERIPLGCWPAYVSQALRESIARIFPEKAAPLVTALVTGERTLLSAGAYSALRRTGLAHVIVVSGLHVSFLVSVLSFVLGRNRKRTAAAGIGLMFFFAAVAGNTPSILRAAFMHSMLLLAPLVDREEDRPTSLAAILLLVLVWNPYAAASISLQLSFAAVAGIYLLGDPLYCRWTRRISPGGRLAQRVARPVLGTLAASIGAAVFTIPLTVWHFDSISLVSPLANLLAFWAVSVTFVAGLCLALLGLLLPGPAAAAARLVSFGADWIEWITRTLARLPFVAVGLGSVYLRLWLLLAYALLALWLLWRGEKKRFWFPVGTGALCLCAALAFHTASHRSVALSISVLDVGQGLCVAVCSGEENVLVDCGGAGGLDAGDTAADYLQDLGFMRLDRLILTHYHSDHAGGVPQLMERMEVGELVLPAVTPEEPLRREIEELALRHGTGIRWVAEDTVISLGDARLRVYAPLGAGSANEEGLSVLCSSGSFDMLITGDMDAVTEKRLVKYGNLPDIELLVAGHHGSKYASSEELLLATAPEYAVISVGYNRYGHPAPETLERLAAAGCEIYRTDWMGTVAVTVRGGDGP